MKEIYIDRPITQIKEDCLGRIEFAQNLANTLCNENMKDGYTVGLYGSWGCGKTSLLNIIEKYIEQKQNVKVIHFNPWLCDNANQMAIQFFSLLLNEFTDSTKKALTDFAATLFDCIGINSVVSVDTKKIADMLSIERKPLLTQKNELNKMLKDSVKFIIMIDDIDRLNKEEVSEIFRLVKSIADFPNIVYLLSFDREKVVQLLNSVNNSNDGDNYLEKIIQYPIEVPQPSDNAVRSYFGEHLMNCVDNYNDNYSLSAIESEEHRLRSLLESGIVNLINNIRDCKRFLNIYLFNINSIGSETNLTDLIGITALQVFSPDIYRRIQSSKAEILRTSFGTDLVNKSDSDKKKAAELFINYLIGKTGDVVRLSKKEYGCREIIKLLFPNILNYYNRGNETINTYRISSEYCFDRYFTLQLAKDSISNADLNTIFSSYDKSITSTLVQRIENSDKLELLLRHIQEKFSNSYANSIDIQIKCNIYLTIMEVWDNNSYKYSDYTDGLFGFNFRRVITRLKPLIEGLPEKKKIELFVDSIENLKPINSIQLFDEIEELCGRIRDSIPDSKILSLEGLQVIENSSFDLIERLIGNGKLWVELQTRENTYFLRLIYVLGFVNIDLCDKLKLYVKNEIEKSDSRLLEWICHECVSKGEGANTTESWVNYSIHYSDEYISFDKALERLKKYSETNEYKKELIYLKKKFSAIMIHDKSDKEMERSYGIKEQDVINYMNDIEKMSQENDAIKV